MSLPLMPKATAVWLIENTSLTFVQIAEFCGLHILEVQAIADGEVATGMNGFDPIANGQLTSDEIARCEKDQSLRLKLLEQEDVLGHKKKKARYTPVSRRQDRPDAIAWVLKNHPELSMTQMTKLLGTTKSTIVSIRDRTHWNVQNIRPRHPVILGLCSQKDLDEAVRKVGGTPSSDMSS